MAFPPFQNISNWPHPENTKAARELLQTEKGDAIRAQAARRVAELKDLMVA